MVSTFQKLVEDMVVSLARILLHNSWFFHEVPVYESASNLPWSSELDAYEFTKTRWVVIPYGLCIPKRFKYWIGSENLLWEVRKLACRRFWAKSVRCGHRCKILDDFLGVLRLTSSRFASMTILVMKLMPRRSLDSRNQDALIFTLLNQVSECTVSHRINMWLRIFSATALVHFHILIGIDRQRTVRVNSN